MSGQRARGRRTRREDLVTSRWRQVLSVELMELGRQLTKFDILESRETTLDGLEAIRMRDARDPVVDVPSDRTHPGKP